METKGRNLVYFIADRHYIKIGYTKNLPARLHSIQTSNSEVITLLGYKEFDSESAARRYEKELHKKFKGVKYGGEWFRKHYDLLKIIENETQNCYISTGKKHFKNMDPNESCEVPIEEIEKLFHDLLFKSRKINNTKVTQ